MIGRHRLIWLLAVVALLASACVSEPHAACERDSAEFDLALTADSLSPNSLEACKGQQVTITVSSEADGVFHIHGYDDEIGATPVESGEQVTLEFTATHVGQFPIELHPSDDPQGVGIGVFTVYES